MLTDVVRAGLEPAELHQPEIKETGSEKLLFLESIRGLAALVVVVYHIYLGFYPELFKQRTESGIGSFLETGLAHLLLNGAFAVDLFFVLSGFVLSISFFRSFDRNVVSSAAIRRYFRLLLPVFASVMIAWTIQVNRGFRNQQAAVRMQQPETEWLYKSATKKLKFWPAVKQGAIDAFFAYDSRRSINTSLWTMEAELKGSFFVFGFLALCGGYSRRILIYGALFTVFIVVRERILLDFLCGVALCDWMMALRRRGSEFSLRIGWSLALIVTGVVVGAISSSWLAGEGISFPWDTKRMRAVAAVLLLVGVLGCPLIQRFLEWRPFAALGRISFALYVIHGPLLFSLGCAVYLLFRDFAWSHGASVAMMGAIYLPISLAAAWVLYRVTDLPSIRFGRWVEKQVRG